MPELPEVETSVRGISPFLLQQVIINFHVFNPRLRWLVPAEMAKQVEGAQVERIWRRGKYIIMQLNNGKGLLWHLGMSGSLRIDNLQQERRKHDHIELVVNSEACMRYHDPRRFGCCLLFDGNPLLHPLIARLGLEPLTDDFDADYLFTLSRQRKSTVKEFIMNSKIVVGVGNIYASESLFYAGINPKRKACNVSKPRYRQLVDTIKKVLTQAIAQGGSSLNDFVNADGNPGYFQQTLAVYGRTHEPCNQCGLAISHVTIGQRSTYYCKNCQH